MWQPIETAPRDGSNVIVWDNESRLPAVASWHWFGDMELMQGCWEADKAIYYADYSKVYDNLDTRHVTHWMPLPEPPEE